VSAVPEHAPPHPTKVDPLAGAAVSVTVAALPKLAVQVVPQLTPAGEDVTVPLPVPARVTLSGYRIGFALNVAVTVRPAVIVTVQVTAVPVHAPLQPAKALPVAGVARRVTTVPLGNGALHVVPQLTPAGVEATVPVPVPLRVTLSVCWTGWVVKVAATERAPDIVTTQAAVPVHAPLQPAKTLPVAGVAVRVTTAPAAKLALQVVPQLTPAGDEVTVPLPDRVTVSVYRIGWTLNAASTDRAADIATTQAPVPEHAPLHPAKTEPLAGAGVSVTSVPSA